MTNRCGRSSAFVRDFFAIFVNMPKGLDEFKEIRLEPRKGPNDWPERRRLIKNQVSCRRHEIAIRHVAKLFCRTLGSCDDRLTASHRLKERHTEAFTAIWEHENVRAAIKTGELQIVERFEDREDRRLLRVDSGGSNFREQGVVLISAGRSRKENHERDAFAWVKSSLEGVKEQVGAFASNDATHKEKDKFSTTLRAKGGTFRGEYFGIVTVGNYCDAFRINTVSNKNFADELRWHPKLIHVLTDLINPDARHSSVLPRENDSKFSRWWTAKVGWPLVANG